MKSISSFFLKKQTVIIAYILLALIIGIKQYLHGSFNNYLIYKYTFWHSIDFKNLYLGYPEYNDSNHYGPIFAIFAAPFALLPDGFGMVLWNVANVAILLWGIFSLPITIKKRVLIAWICIHEALTALLSFQFNIALTGLIILSFSYLVKKKEIQSAFFIAFGTLVKLYGIVGLAFFFFTKNKVKFIVGGLLALFFFFLLPMILSSPVFVMQTYTDWFQALSHKNGKNASLTSFQDISIMGMTRRITGDINIPNLPFIIAGVLIFCLPYIRIKQYQHLGFRLMLLASTLIFTVIFSSGSESPTYIIAFAGVAIWFIIQPNPKNNFLIALLLFAILLTSLSPTDIFPRPVKEFIRLYSLKALPCIIIWFTIVYQMMRTDFSRYSLTENE